MSFQITRNVNGLFDSDDKDQELSTFINAALHCVYNFSTCVYLDENKDHIVVTFDGDENQRSVSELDAFLSGFLEPSLMVERKRLMTKINELRDKIQYDRFNYAGRRWDARPEARALITGASALAITNGGNLPAGFLYRDYDNYNWPMTGTDMIHLGAALFEFTGICYQASWIHKYCIGITTTKEELAAYDYTVGWPPFD